MRRLTLATALALAGLGCGSGHQGQTHGKCSPPDAPGAYRCIGNKVEICTASDHPDRDLPDWFVVQDCGIPTSPGAYGACVVRSDGVAVCQR